MEDFRKEYINRLYKYADSLIDERICLSPRMKCELEHLQELYHIQGGEVPDKDFVLLIQEYTKELKNYTDTHNGEWPAWLNTLIETRYGFKPYNL